MPTWLRWGGAEPGQQGRAGGRGGGTDAETDQALWGHHQGAFIYGSIYKNDVTSALPLIVALKWPFSVKVC